jgi:hypothetical protein
MPQYDYQFIRRKDDYARGQQCFGVKTFLTKDCGQLSPENPFSIKK